MAKKARQRISYVLDLPNSSPGGHKLGVNGLTVDRQNAILYSGGRDGVVCAWDLNLDSTTSKSSVTDSSPAAPNGTNPKSKHATRFRAQTVAHTHWINDLALAQNHSAVVSASSDLLVKVWRPLGASAREEPATIGRHADYVKCVATPSQNTNWVASGGLDRKIYLWDVAGGGKTLEIDVSGEEVTEKGSVYALAVNANLMASGGPESIVRLWDPKTGKSIAKFVGHRDNVRAILVNNAADTVITASADQTVKVWSVTAGRCMHTLTMHSDSVWSLFAEDPDLGVFYSSDRSGLVAKTDVRGTFGELDDGLSVAVAQEPEGVSKIVAFENHIWTATSRSSINRWANVDTSAEVLPEAFRQHRASIAGGRSREGSLSSPTPAPATLAVNGSSKEIPLKSILRISNTAFFPAAAVRDDDEGAPLSRKGSEILIEPVATHVEPIHILPEETIEGQFGLVKHRLLNDRRRVLTLDTAGDVLLWDLIKCEPIQSFGKKHLEDVEPEVNTLEAVAPWCSIDTSSGTLTVVLEPFNCFDAEMYADDLATEESMEFRDDQRINLGKWILRYLFANLIDEEIRRDEDHRHKLNEAVDKRIAAAVRAIPPTSIIVPEPLGFEPSGSLVTTPRANGSHYPPQTPGLSIGLATPGLALPVTHEDLTTPLSPEGKRSSQLSRPSVEKEDYFSNAIHTAADPNKLSQTPAAEPTAAAEDKAKTPGENGKEKEKEKEKDKDGKGDGGKGTTPFGKKFRMGMSFGSKKIGRSASTTAPEKPAVEEKTEEQNSESSSNHEKEVEDSFLGVIQKVQNEYEKLLADSPDKHVETKVTPSLPNDTPVLKLPPATKVIIQEETSGGSVELYRGTVETVGTDVDVIEKCGPMWLGEVLLLNATPQKDPVKVSFILHPWQDKLPSIASTDGNNRLNANRMLRVRKILAYVAERIESSSDTDDNEDTDALRPEEYLELYCNEQLLPNTMTLATLRAHIWKGGNDVMLYYKANGKKEIAFPPPPPPAPVEAEAEGAASVPAAQPAPVAA